MFAGSAGLIFAAISVLVCCVQTSATGSYEWEGDEVAKYEDVSEIFIADQKDVDSSEKKSSQDEHRGFKLIGDAFYDKVNYLLNSGELDDRLEEGKKDSERTETILSRNRRAVEGNRPPSFTSPVIINANEGESASIRVTATDPDGDDLVFSLVGESDIASITPDGWFTTSPLIMSDGIGITSLLASLFKIEFQVDDGNGGTDSYSPEWHLCNCGNGGLCNHDSLSSNDGRIHISGCICQEGFLGRSCEDEDECFGGNKCFEGVQCYDNPYPQTGYRCGQCPKGYRGDGVTCQNERECSRPIIANGKVLAKDFKIGSTVAFQCDGGYELVGAETAVCGEDGTFRRRIPTCEDVDECLRSPCHVDANCVNTDGGYFCNCKPDFVGNGKTSCVPLIEFEHFSCESVGNDSIRVNWQVTDAWRGSSSITQFIVSWFRAEEFSEEVEMSLKYNEETFEDYQDLLDDFVQKEAISSLEYHVVDRDRSYFIINGLKPNTRYRVGTRIEVDYNVMSVNPVRECHKLTGEGVSSPPLDLQLEELNPSSVVLSWSAPEVVQGVIHGYVIEYIQASSCDGTDACNNPKTVQVIDQYRNEIFGLLPSTAYLIRIAAVNGAGVGMFSKEIKAITKQGSGVPISPTEEANRDGTCFDGSFVLSDEWKTNPLQQSLLVKNLESTLADVLAQAEFGEATVLDLSLSEMDDVTRVKFHLYIINTSISNEYDYRQWYDRIKDMLISNSGIEPRLKTMRHTTVSVKECDECRSPRLNTCGTGTRCINLLGGHTCQCRAGYIRRRKSSVSSEPPITCVWKGGPKPPQKKPSLRPVFPACDHARYDIVFLIDSSRSVSDPSFRRVRQAIKDFIQGFNIGTYDTQIAFATYSHDIQVAFYLKTNEDKEEVLQAIDNIPYSGFGTRTGNAIQKLLDEIVTSSRGRRHLSQLHVVVVTDGQSADGVEVPARNLHTVTKHVYAIGVGNRINRTELRTIAGKNGRVLHYNSYDTLEEKMATTLQGFLCPSYTCETHDNYMDVVFALESTSRISSQLFSGMKNFVSDVIDVLDIRRTATQVALLTMAADGLDEFSLRQYRTKERVLQAVSDVSGPATGRELNIGKALTHLYGMLLTNRGRRMDAGLVVVLLTSGQSNDDFDEALTSLRKNHGAAIHTIGLANPKRSSLDQLVRPNGTAFVATVRTLSSALKNNLLLEMQKSASCPKRPGCNRNPKRLRKIVRGKRKFC